MSVWCIKAFNYIFVYHNIHDAMFGSVVLGAVALACVRITKIILYVVGINKKKWRKHIIICKRARPSRVERKRERGRESDMVLTHRVTVNAGHDDDRAALFPDSIRTFPPMWSAERLWWTLATIDWWKTKNRCDRHIHLFSIFFSVGASREWRGLRRCLRVDLWKRDSF